jgi:hypothetical protein
LTQNKEKVSLMFSKVQQNSYQQKWPKEDWEKSNSVEDLFSIKEKAIGVIVEVPEIRTKKNVFQANDNL